MLSHLSKLLNNTNGRFMLPSTELTRRLVLARNHYYYPTSVMLSWATSSKTAITNPTSIIQSVLSTKPNEDSVQASFPKNKKQVLLIDQFNKNHTTVSEINPSSSHPVLFLPKSYPEKDYISGLMSLSPNERRLLKELSPLGEEYRKILHILLTKVSDNFTKPEYKTLDECLEKGFVNLFGSLNCLNMSYDLTKMIGEKIIPLIQHFTVVFWNNRNFSYETLKTFAKSKIDCSTYKNQKIKILTFIELTIGSRAINTISKFNKTKITAFIIDPEGLSVLPAYYLSLESKASTGQKHADFLLLENEDGYANDHVRHYFDVKSYLTSGVNFCRFSIYHYDPKLLQQMMNTIVTTVQKHINNPDIKVLHDSLKKIQVTSIKIMSVEEKYNNILGKLIEIMFDKRYQELKISINTNAGEDTEFNIKYIQDYQQRLKDLETNRKHIIEDFFPETPILDKETNKKNITDFYEIAYPEEMHKDIKNQLENLIWPQIENV